MDIGEFLDRLERAVTLQSDDAAIRIHAEYEPQAGWGAKVFPPTYLPSKRSRYHIEKRWSSDGELVYVVVLDSYQSQANRCEEALRRRAEELGLPQIVMEAEIQGKKVRVSSLEAPHRSRDAYFIDSELDGKAFDDTDVGKTLNEATQSNATAFLQHAPYDLIYGVWDSHRGKRIALKFPRAYTSEMLGWQPEIGDRAATKGDPLVLPGEDDLKGDWREWRSFEPKEKKLSGIGHGMVPGTLGTFHRTGQRDRFTSPGVSVRSITRVAVLSLTGLAAFSFGDATASGRATLAALALLADRLAFGGGVDLRSGSNLLLISERMEWVGRGGHPEPFELPRGDAEALLRAAKDRLASKGVAWSARPVLVQPTKRLRTAIEKTFQPADVEE